MSNNKETALQCLAKGQQFMKKDDIDSALRLFHRAERLHSTEQGKQLIKAAEEKKNGTKASASSSSSTSSSTSQAYRRKHGSEKDQEKKEAGNYTPEQLEAVKKINRCTDHYEVLGINKKADEKTIKKAYRKLALQFHPDKNNAPGAEDSFKKIGKAFSVLSDDSARRNYDMYGDTPMATQRRPGGGHGHFQGDVSPEEIFNMFFNGQFNGNRGGTTFYFGGQPGFNRAQRRQRQQQQHSNSQANQLPDFSFLNLLFPMMLFLIYIFSGSADPQYYTLKSGIPGYPIERETDVRGARYFVPYSFSSTFSTNEISKMEKKIEREFGNYLENLCAKERQILNTKINNARWYGNREKVFNLQKQRLEHCVKFDRYKRGQKGTF